MCITEHMREILATLAARQDIGGGVRPSPFERSARTSPGLSATLPYEGRDWATSVANGHARFLALAPLSS